MYAVIRTINGISVNGDEYLLNGDGSTMLFDTKEDAYKFLWYNVEYFECEVVPCLPDGVTKEIKPYPTIWGYEKDSSGRIGTIEVMVPVPGDHPCLLTLEQLHCIKPVTAWTVASEGYD